MSRFMIGHGLRAFFSARSGTTAIEYGLIAALIVLAFVVGFNQLAQVVNNLFTTTSQAIANM